MVPTKKNEVPNKVPNDGIRKGVEFKLRKIEGLTNTDVSEFMKKWDTSKNKTIFEQARKRGAGRIKGKSKTEERAKRVENNNFNTGKAIENLNLETKKKELTEKVKRGVRGVGGTIGLWKPAIEEAKNTKSLEELEKLFNQKAKLRDDIEATDSKKFRMGQKRLLASSAIRLKNDMKETRNIFEKRLRVDELKKYLEGLALPMGDKAKYIRAADEPKANLNAIKSSAEKQLSDNISKASKSIVSGAIKKIQNKENKNISNASKALVAGAINKVKAQEGKYNKVKPKLLEMAEKGGLGFMKKNIEAIKTAEDVKRVDNKIKGILKKRSERRREKKNNDEAEAEATKLFNVSGGVKNLTRGKDERNVDKNVLNRTRKLVGFGLGGKAREKFLTRGRGMLDTKPLVKELDERLKFINNVKTLPDKKELEKLIRNSDTTINKVRIAVKKSQNKVATKIQAAFRGKKNRNRVRKMKLEKGGVTETFVPEKNFKGQQFKVSENPLAMKPIPPSVPKPKDLAPRKKQNRLNAKRMGVSVKKAQKIRQQKQRDAKEAVAKKEEAIKRKTLQEEATKRKAELLAKKKAQADAIRANRERIRKAGEAAEAKRKAKAELRKKNRQLAKSKGKGVKATQKKQQIKRKSNPKKR